MQLQDFMYIQYMHFMQFASSGFSTLPNTTVESSGQFTSIFFGSLSIVNTSGIRVGSVLSRLGVHRYAAHCVSTAQM